METLAMLIVPGLFLLIAGWVALLFARPAGDSNTGETSSLDQDDDLQEMHSNIGRPLHLGVGVDDYLYGERVSVDLDVTHL